MLSAIILIAVSCTGEPVFHTVSYVTGNNTVKSPIRVRDGYLLKQDDLDAPTGDAASVFSGWFVGEEKIEAGYKVVSDMTLHAVWKGEGTGDNPGGGGQDGTAVILGYATGKEKAPNSRLLSIKRALRTEDLVQADGLEGWYFANGKKACVGDMIQKDTVLLARYTDGQDGIHMLTFHSDVDGKGQSTGWRIQYGDSIQELIQTLPEGASCWQTRDGVAWDPSWPVYGDLDLYPLFDTIRVTFIMQDNTARTVEIPRGSRIPVPDGSRADEGAWFADGEGFRAWDFNEPALSDTVLFHNDEGKAKVTVSYDAAGFGTAPEAVTVLAGSILTEKELPALSHPPMGFYGWKDNNGTVAVAGKYRVDSDTVLSAIWCVPGEKGVITEVDLTAHADSITLSWTNPDDLDLIGTRIEIRKNGSSAVTGTVDIGAEPGKRDTREFTGLAAGNEYTYTLFPVFAGNNAGGSVTISGIPSRYAGSEGWVYGIVPPGPERWSTNNGKVRPYAVWQEGDLWFDVNKTYWADKENNLEPAHDRNLCWAAGASSVLHWWLAMNAENVERYGKYDGPSSDYPADVKNSFDKNASIFQTSEIFQYFIMNSVDMAGFDEEAVNWFIAGYDGYMSSPIINPENKGGFFRDVFSGKKLSRLSKSLGKGSFSREIANALAGRKGICYSAAPLDSNLGHLMTIWGAGFDKQGYVSYMYTVDNNPPGGDMSVIIPRIEKNMVEYGINLEGATFAKIEYGQVGNFNKIQDFRLISLGEETWREYFEKTGL